MLDRLLSLDLAYIYMYSRPQGRRFVNISIKWRFPRHSIVNITNPKDKYFEFECRVIGWTASRVILVTIDTGERLTRVPKNLTKPPSFTEL